MGAGRVAIPYLFVAVILEVILCPPGQPATSAAAPDLVAAKAGPPTTAAAIGSGFASQRITMLSRVPISSFAGSATRANDIWGYVSPSGREYAIVGLNRGTGFVEVTDPRNPVVIATIDDAQSDWSDMAVYRQVAYNVNETGGGLQMINLTGIDAGAVASLGSATSGPSTAHNVYVNPVSGYAYIVGSNVGGGGIVTANLADPANPQFDGLWSETYVHDIYVVTFFAGTPNEKEIAFAFAADAGLKIIDVTDKSHMVTLSTFAYPNLTYCHQGWLADDHKLLYVDDELDELQNPAVNQTTTYVINVEDLRNPWSVRSFTTGLHSIDHNLMVRGDYVFEANYTSGLHMFHVADIASVTEVGFFDTYPSTDAAVFAGAWGVYTGLPSRVILVSDINSGLFVLMADCNENDMDDARELAQGLATDCNGNGILDACDIQETTSEDCNSNGLPDECDSAIVYHTSSGQLSPIGADSPQSFTLDAPPAAAGDVTLFFTARADLRGGELQSIDVDIDGTPIGSVFTAVLARCPLIPYEDQLTIAAATFNELAAGAQATINMRPTVWVATNFCSAGDFIQVDVDYIAVGSSLDCNGTGTPDECESGDLNGDREVTLDDWSAFTACLTPPCSASTCGLPTFTDPCCGLADFDHDGDGDLSDFAAWQRTIALP